MFQTALCTWINIKSLCLSTLLTYYNDIITYTVCILQAWGEDQDPGEESERPDRRELHGTQHGNPTTGQTLSFFGVLCLVLMVDWIWREAFKWR